MLSWFCRNTLNSSNDPRAMTVEESQDICDRIERAIRREIAGAMITIHMEPDPKMKYAPCFPIAGGGGWVMVREDGR